MNIQQEELIVDFHLQVFYEYFCVNKYKGAIILFTYF